MSSTSRTIAPLFVFVAVVCGAVVGCEGIAQQSETERRIQQEQLVIKAYSNEVPKVDGKLAAFLASWNTANEKKDLKAYKQDIEANVLPALDELVKAVEAMPLGSTQLRAIHAPLVSAYQDARESFRNFLKNVTEDTFDAEYTRVLEAMDRVTKAEGDYLQSLQAYYKDYRVDLEKAP